jgi:hypothetical protein
MSFLCPLPCLFIWHIGASGRPLPRSPGVCPKLWFQSHWCCQLKMTIVGWWAMVRVRICYLHEQSPSSLFWHFHLGEGHFLQILNKQKTPKVFTKIILKYILKMMLRAGESFDQKFLRLIFRNVLTHETAFNFLCWHDLKGNSK